MYYIRPGLICSTVKFEGICTVLPDKSVYDSTHMQKSDVSAQQVQVWQVTVNTHNTFCKLDILLPAWISE